jgi:hypothetical protein
MNNLLGKIHLVIIIWFKMGKTVSLVLQKKNLYRCHLIKHLSTPNLTNNLDPNLRTIVKVNR